MGCYLRRHIHDARFWDQTIEKLGHAQAIQGGQNDRVWASLRLSYDALSPEEKEMFIDAATTFCDEQVDNVFCVWRKLYKNVESMWANLLNTSMVKEVLEEGFHEVRSVQLIWVHEQLRDLGKSLGNGNMIVADTQWQCDEIVDLLNAREVKVEARSLQISYPGDPDENRKILRLDSLNELQTLKYMVLEGVLLEQPSFFHRKSPFKAKKNFPKNLFRLYWSNPLIKNRAHPLLPISLEEIRNVVHLSLRNWRISKESFESLGKLVSLGTLILYRIEGLERLPENFGNLSSLKWLQLESLALSILPDSIGNLSALECLFLFNLDISQLPESFGNLSSLRLLLIDNCKLMSWPDSFGRLSSLELLTVTNCESLKTLPNNFSQLPRLQRLHWVRDNADWNYRRERPQVDSALVPLT